MKSMFCYEFVYEIWCIEKIIWQTVVHSSKYITVGINDINYMRALTESLEPIFLGLEEAEKRKEFSSFSRTKDTSSNLSKLSPKLPPSPFNQRCRCA